VSDVIFVTGWTEWKKEEYRIKNKDLNQVTLLPEVHNTAI
jgi:hypothetical protein